MGIELVGSRIDGVVSTQELIDGMGACDGHVVCIASAYWDTEACATAIASARRLRGTVRLLLWTAGATRAAWEAAQAAHVAPELELRFIDSPDGGGIFHAKLAGIEGDDGHWRAALVGSGNLTAAGIARNVELGLLVRDEPPVLAQLRTWFDRQWSAARRAESFDFATAIAIAPAKSEAAERKRTFAQAALAPPSPAPALRN